MTKTTLFFFFLAISPLLTWGQTDSSNIQLQEATISSERIQLPFSEENRTIQILNRRQLQALPVRSIAEALQSMTGVDVRQRGPLGIQADLHVRGGGFDQVLILLNGVRLSDPQTGHHLLNVPVDWSNIERIEVLKGPGTRIYGQNAFACSINIITRIPDKKALEVGLAAGDFGFLSGSISVAVPQNRVRQQVAVSGDFSDGYRSNTDFQVLNAFYQASLKNQKDNGEWSLLADFNARKFGANGYYGRLEYTDQYEAVQTSVLSLGYSSSGQGQWRIKPRISWRRNQDLYDFQRSNPSNTINFHLSQVATAELNTVAYWANGAQTGLGGNVEYTSLISSKLGIRQRTTLNLFVEQQLRFLQNRLDFTPGIAFSHFSDFGSFAYPGLDAGYKINRKWRVYANTGYNYRIPTFTDLYYEDPGNKGNPNLKPERAFSVEAGVKFKQHGLLTDLQFAVFQRNSRNLIDWTKENEADRWETRNYNAILMQGFECSGALYIPACKGHLTLAYTYLDANVSDNVAFSRYSLNHLRHQFNGGFDYQIWGKLHHSMRVRWCDRIVQQPETKSDYTVADTKIWFAAKSWTLYAEAVNVFDVTYGELRYSDTAVLTLPGRWFRAGINLHF